MSVELAVYLRRERLPTRDVWQRAIEAEGIDLKLDNVDTTTHTGFWPTKLGNAECGFEYWFDRLENQEPDEILQNIGDRDHRASFVWHSSLDDGRAAAFVAIVLAKVSDGVLFDPQSGEMTIGANALDTVRNQDRSVQEFKMEQAIKEWTASTQRRCPQCDAPCPEYRPTCFVCSYKIGRA
jgi:hypothetical protein